MNSAWVNSKTVFQKTVEINAPISQVWDSLTKPELMKKWMMPDIELHIVTDWKVGNPILINGNMNGKDFQNKGIVLEFEPEKTLQYSHLSSISRLPERPESYALFQFQLFPTERGTQLGFALNNFPTESIYKHLVFYWNVTLEVLKRTAEEQGYANWV